MVRLLHWQNVEYVLMHGLCCREHENADPNYINIGHRQLILDRHEHAIPIPGAGNLGEYVPFYFAGHSPMLYLIMNGYRGVQMIRQEDLVYIGVYYSKIKEHELEFVFTDRNAMMALANFYNDESDFDKINWDIVRSKQWRSDETNLERQDLKQAEFLVRSHVPVSCIQAIIVKTPERKVYFENIIANLGLKIAVKQDDSSKLYY
jgi:hypothetical protein